MHVLSMDALVPPDGQTAEARLLQELVRQLEQDSADLAARLTTSQEASEAASAASETRLAATEARLAATEAANEEMKALLTESEARLTERDARLARAAAQVDELTATVYRMYESLTPAAPCSSGAAKEEGAAGGNRREVKPLDSASEVRLPEAALQ